MAFISRKTARGARERARAPEAGPRRERGGAASDRRTLGGRGARHITLLISLIHTIVQSRCFILYFHTLVLVDTPAVTIFM